MSQKPYISPSTQKRMCEFFLKTSAPRLYELKMKEEEKAKNQKQA